MDLSRKWLNEFVETSDIGDKDFAEAMTLSGSKVETFTALDKETVSYTHLDVYKRQPMRSLSRFLSIVRICSNNTTESLERP